MNKPNYSIENFGLTASGQTVQAINLSCGAMSCRILSFGATVQALTVPDRNGNPLDVVLGYDSVEEYQKHDAYLGAVVGRYANRIAKGRFTLNGKEYVLAQNNGENHLHGGLLGFSHKVWDVEDVGDCFVRLHLSSPDGDEGYPGNMDVWVTYTLSGNSLSIRYEARSDADTLCNLTNHSYFNLAGHNSGTVYEQELALNAEYYTPAEADNIPTGEIAAVAGTPMDLHEPTKIGQHINDDFIQLQWAKGYDQNFVVDGTVGELRPAATAYCAESGICMKLESTMPGLQLYTANYLDKRAGKGGCTYDLRHAFCLETQQFPDAPNRANFPSPVLKAGEKFEHLSRFSFSII